MAKVHNTENKKTFDFSELSLLFDHNRYKTKNKTKIIFISKNLSIFDKSAEGVIFGVSE